VLAGVPAGRSTLRRRETVPTPTEVDDADDADAVCRWLALAAGENLVRRMSSACSRQMYFTFKTLTEN